MFNRKSEYALNKANKSSIVYIDANDNVTMLTARDFSSEKEFRKWKNWMDMKSHAEEKRDHVHRNHTITLSPGLTYNKNDIVIEYFKDADCTDLITTWTQADGKFNVTYNTTTAKESTMTIEMTERGLAEINTAKTVYTGSSMVNSGYSDCTIRITYAATMNSDDSVVYGDSGNPNKVVLTWKRSSDAYYDTLIDDAHVFTYAVELTKLFSDGQGKFENVEFLMQNANDG